MQVTIEELSATERRLAVELPADEVRAELDQAFGRLRNQAQIKGFRPGRAPRAILERYFGERVRADVLTHLIEHSYSKAIEDAGLKPVAPPEIVPQNLEVGGPLRYSATIEVQPEVEIREYRGLRAKRPRRPVTDRDVDHAIEQIRNSLAELRPVDGRDIPANGDFVTIDYTASVEGRELPGGRRENRLLQLGAGAVPKEVEEALESMAVGDKRTVDVEFPVDHPDAEVAGKTARFDIELRAIREKILPPVDDDLAKEHGECETLDELRERVRGRLAEAIRREADEQVREQLVAELLVRNPFELPRSLCERQTDALVEEVLERNRAPREEIDRDPKRLEQIRNELRPRAERQVRAVLALDALARQLEVTVADAELEERLTEMAERLGDSAEKVRAAYREPAARETLRSRITRERVLDAILSSAAIEEVDATGEAEE